MANPSISMPDDMRAELDERNAKPNRSKYVQEALLVRFAIEDGGEWDRLLAEAQADFPDLTDNPAIHDEQPAES